MLAENGVHKAVAVYLLPFTALSIMSDAAFRVALHMINQKTIKQATSHGHVGCCCSCSYDCGC